MATSKTCPQCGTAVADRANKLYCSAACKLRAFRQKSTTEEFDSGAVETLSERKESPLRQHASVGRIRSTNSTTSTDARALRVQAEMRKAEMEHELALEKLRIAARERAEEREREAQRPTVQPTPPPPSVEDRWRAAQEVKEAQEREQRDKKLDARYEELVADFLDLEDEELLPEAFAELLKELKSHEAAYRKHSALRSNASAQRQRLDFLDQMQTLLRETLHEIEDQPEPFFGQKTGGFSLKKKWRTALRDTLLAVG